MFYVQRINENTVRCQTQDYDLRLQLADHFSFEVQGARHQPKVKSGLWDGRIRMYSPKYQTLPMGLLSRFVDYAKDNGIDVVFEDPSLVEPADVEFDWTEYVSGIEPRDYQLETVNMALANRRGVYVCPTGSGKSLMIYLVLAHLRKQGKKALLIVPTVNLVNQMKTEFIEYGCDEDAIHTITSGAKKTNEHDITIATHQSLNRLAGEFFEPFDVAIGDECHHFKAKTLNNIMNRMPECEYRFGFTGTLDDMMMHQYAIEGLFGKADVITTTKQLMDSDVLAKIEIKALEMIYQSDECRGLMWSSYQEEIQFLCAHERRNNFILELAKRLPGNSLFLFSRVDTHGKNLLKMFECLPQPVYYVDGKVKKDKREEIRKQVDQETHSTLLASYGTFSTGVNIKNINNVVFCSPSKSKIRTLQSIGRGLRKAEGKTEMRLYDIVDNLTWRERSNYTLRHFLDRVEIYAKEGFSFDTIRKNL